MGHRTAPSVGLLVGLAFIDASIAAPRIEVASLGCANGVHLVANDAPVSDVLDELARVKGFRISAEGRISTPITVDAVQSTRQLLTTILGEENTIVNEEADVACPGRFRVATVWIVGKGSPSVGATQKPLPPKAASAYVTPEAKEQDDLYRRAHGMLPE